MRQAETALWVFIIVGIPALILIWRLSAAISRRVASIDWPDRILPVLYEPPETPLERYHRRLAKIEELPLTDVEKRVAKEVVRKQFIAEAGR